MNLAYLGADGIEVAVQFKVFLGLALRLSLCRVPVVGGDIAVGVYLRPLPVHRDSEDDCRLSLLVQPRAFLAMKFKEKWLSLDNLICHVDLMVT